MAGRVAKHKSPTGGRKRKAKVGRPKKRKSPAKRKSPVARKRPAARRSGRRKVAAGRKAGGAKKRPSLQAIPTAPAIRIGTAYRGQFLTEASRRARGRQALAGLGRVGRVPAGFYPRNLPRSLEQVPVAPAISRGTQYRAGQALYLGQLRGRGRATQ